MWHLFCEKHNSQQKQRLSKRVQESNIRKTNLNITFWALNHLYELTIVQFSLLCVCLPPTLCFDVIHSWTWSFDGDLTGTGAASCIVHCPKTEPEDTNIHKGTQNFEDCLTYEVSTKPNLQQIKKSHSKTLCCTKI